MKILIIDDEVLKTKQIFNYIKKDNTFIETATNYRDGMFSLENNDYNYVILDMNFPLFKDSELKKEMGLELLSFVNRSCRFKEKIRKIKFIICSSGINNTIMDEIFKYENVIGYINFNSSIYLKEEFEGLLK